ncbi:formate--tetrahydrofolate ligase-domain-containing protein [Chiua virens]|nr:formate--tetrahydrofolate ligase-domain-containing protein [Chiua virens]
MSYSLINGTLVAKLIHQSVVDRVAALKLQFPRFQPHPAVVQAGDRPDSTVYIRMKAKALEEVGIRFQHVTLPEAASVQELPLGPHIDPDSVRTVTKSISPEKDVDGFHAYNIGHLSSRASSPLFTPCTPADVIRLLESTGVTISGANTVVLGRSDIVGNPVVNLEQFVRQADILVAAIGQAEFVKGSWIKPGAVVIDVGINSIPDATKMSGQRLVSDVEYDQAALYASHITPVPGGVGPMTVALLMESALTAAVRQFEQARARKLVPLPLDIKTQVPSDIEIAMAHTLKPVTQPAREIGLQPDESESYGKHKAKVELGVLNRLAHRKDGKYIVISGITPTPLGEGKSTTTIGLAQALGAHLGRPAFACVRQPSQGPTFGIKGGPARGDYS